MRTRLRGARPILAVLAAIMAVALLAAPVAAGSPAEVTIVSHVTFNPDGPNFGDFAATGAAVDRGVICPEGTFVDTFVHFAGFESNIFLAQLQAGKVFTCADGSGTFNAKLQIQATFDTGFETFSWVVMGGSGRYAALHGSGSGSSVPTPTRDGNTNTYSGFMLR